MTTFDRITSLHTLPTLPANFSRLISVLNDEQASLRDLEEIIRHDQALAARIVSVANSPGFGYAGYINSLEQAMLLLGMDLIRSLAIGISIFQSFPLPPTVLKQMWAHAFSVGTMSSLLSRKIANADRGVAFLGGLLHDIGRIILLTLFPDNYSFRQDPETIVPTEIERFQCSHAEAGHHFLKKLYVPDEGSESVLYHHSIDMSNPHRDVIACVYFAEGLMQIQNTAFGSDGLWTDDHLNLFTVYGLGAKDIDELAAIVMSQEAELMSFFKI